MINRANLKLSEQILIILDEMEQFHFSNGTIKLFRRVYNRLERLAESMNKILFDEDLAQAFVNDSKYTNTSSYCHSRFCLHNRCIQFIKSFISTGIVDWDIRYKKIKRKDFKFYEFKKAYNEFIIAMNEKQLKRNTVEGYERIVYYFLNYCEEKGYNSLDKIHGSDITSFIEKLCREHLQSTNLVACLPGLKLFLSLSDVTKILINSLPSNLQRKRSIIPVLEDEEYKKFIEYLKVGNLPYRDAAICWIAIEIGLRAVDICNLKINNIDWKNDIIHIIQQKTSKPHEIPLRSTYGNAIANYILYERPETDSPYLFLTTKAPFSPLSSHAGCYKIIYHAFYGAGILKPERICGRPLKKSLGFS